MHGSSSAGAGKPTDGTCVRVEEDAGVRHQDDRAHLGYKGDGQCCYCFCLVMTNKNNNGNILCLNNNNNNNNDLVCVTRMIQLNLVKG